VISSTRRHTRCYRDWSSDVCSSDLNSGCPPRPCPGTRVRNSGGHGLGGHPELEHQTWIDYGMTVARHGQTSRACFFARRVPTTSSEERRVGKVCSFTAWSNKYKI